MPTNRTRIKRAVRSRVTDEAVALFRLCEDIADAGGDEKFEDEGGRRREYLDAHSALHSALGLMPWETNPVNAVCETPPDYMRNKHEDWHKAWELRCELEAH
jgi:hypothetical protein